MALETFSWGELKWIAPVGVVVAGVVWRFLRPACETFFFFIGEGDKNRHAEFVRTPLANELQQIEDLCDRIGDAERMLSAHADSMAGFEESLLRQGATLRDQITQVFEPLRRTLEKMEKSLEHIARDTNSNSVAIGELRGLWDGSERRGGGGDRRSANHFKPGE